MDFSDDLFSRNIQPCRKLEPQNQEQTSLAIFWSYHKYDHRYSNHRYSNHPVSHLNAYLQRELQTAKLSLGAGGKFGNFNEDPSPTFGGRLSSGVPTDIPHSYVRTVLSLNKLYARMLTYIQYPTCSQSSGDQ